MLLAVTAVFVGEERVSRAQSEVAKLRADVPTANAAFGRDVSINGNTAVVGEPFTSGGRAYVFDRDGAGNWGPPKKLTGDGGEYGVSVGISADTVVVGARHDADGGSKSGAAWVYERNEGGSNNWGQVVKLKASDAAPNDSFGFDVAISGDTIVVGARQFDSNGTGKAYVYVRDGGSWTEAAKLFAFVPGATDDFGFSVAISGDTIVVGARLKDGAMGADSGAAYVFEKPIAGWGGMITETKMLTAPDESAGDQFGVSVSVSGSTVVAGAWLADASDSDSGAAYAFVEPSGGWSGGSIDVSKLTAADGAQDDQFGWAVANHADMILVGAYADDNITGSAYLFRKPTCGWPASLTASCKIVALDRAAGDNFGIAVSITEGNALIGAFVDDDPFNSGSAYVYRTTPKLTAFDAAAGDAFGREVSISGETIVVGAPFRSELGFQSGVAYVFDRDEGCPGNWGTVQKLIPFDGAAGDEYAVSVAISEDTIVVGARHDDDKGSQSGSAYVYERDAMNNWVFVKKLTASDGVASDSFGFSVAVSGDTIVVGARQFDSNGTGKAYAFERAGGIWSEVAILYASDGAAGDDFGWSVSVNGGTAVVGARNADGGAGSAYVFRKDDAWAQVAELNASDRAAQANFGWASSVSGGDTIVVGAVEDRVGGAGAAYLFVKPAGGWTLPPPTSPTPPPRKQPYCRLRTAPWATSLETPSPSMVAQWSLARASPMMRRATRVRRTCSRNQQVVGLASSPRVACLWPRMAPVRTDSASLVQLAGTT